MVSGKRFGPLAPLQGVEHELLKVLDGTDEPVTVEELEQVVRRAGQRRRASLVAGAAALVSLGAMGGALAHVAADAALLAIGMMPPRRRACALLVLAAGLTANEAGQALGSPRRR